MLPYLYSRGLTLQGHKYVIGKTLKDTLALPAMLPFDTVIDSLVFNFSLTIEPYSNNILCRSPVDKSGISLTEDE
jgi:hypothetical protein